MTDYRQLRLTKENQDVYFHLKDKADLIAEVSKIFNGKLLDVGCGRMPYKNIILENPAIEVYTGVDIENEIYQTNTKPDFFWDGKVLPFPDGSYDNAILIEVLEHVPDAQAVLKELARVLKKGSLVLITVPFLWNLHDVPYDEFRYTPFSLKRICGDAGYDVVKMEGFGGWHAALATIMATFARRAPLSKFKRQILSTLFLPVVKYLFKIDKYNFQPNNFEGGQMITGLKCLIRKS